MNMEDRKTRLVQALISDECIDPPKRDQLYHDYPGSRAEMRQHARDYCRANQIEVPPWVR
jgi:hypothetical protein